tara:strand:- start:2092 stop:3093 length:1002 start_codon:yes stop_codon:yes gene_type:complete
MILNKYRLKPVSSVSTPLKADTISGQLLCHYAEKHGQQAMNTLVKGLRDGNVPFVVSDGLPSGYLPGPVLPGLPRGVLEDLVSQHPKFKENRFKALSQLKKFKKASIFISKDKWMRFRGNLSLHNLFLDFLKKDESRVPGWGLETVSELHNIIDRQTGRSLIQGGLFTSETTWHAASKRRPGVLDLYVGAKDKAWHEELKDLLQRMGQFGFGRDASTGKGHFSLEGPEDASELLKLDDADAKMTVSTCATKIPEQVNGWYHIKPKFGKAWNGFGETRPFKKPLLMFESGSVFTNYPEPLGHGILTGVHRSNPDILQYTTALLLPTKLDLQVAT